MSVSQLGESVLTAVEEDNLSEILSNLRQNKDANRQRSLGCAIFDRFLNALPSAPGNPSSRNTVATSPSNIAVPEGEDVVRAYSNSSDVQRRRLAVIHLTSGSSVAGKTSLLYYLTALSVLPHNCGGRQQAVLWLDTDSSFSVSRLAAISGHYLLSNSENLGVAETEHVVNLALRHVHVFAVQSSKQLIEILQALPTYLFSNVNHEAFPTHHSAHRSLSLIVLDPATAFFWQDRFDTDIERLESLHTNQISGSTSSAYGAPKQSVTSQVITELKALRELFDCTILYTTNNSSITTVNHQYRTEEPAVGLWSANATLNLMLSRIEVSRFAPQISLAACLGDKEKRSKIILDDRIRITVHGSAVDATRHSVAEGLHGSERISGFTMRVSAGAVVLDEQEL